MTSSSEDHGKHGPRSKDKSKQSARMPGWTAGLRQLYDEVVDEELPDSFHELLNKLDDSEER
ncbi:MAG: NepR family anti-sigma factor [Pseudomonadota bacterium]|nr:NepR family anti-sigma factor [Pseudomonadota bacterium]